MGLPETVKPVGVVIATEVTVPPPPPATVSQDNPPVAVEEAIKTLPSEPTVNFVRDVVEEPTNKSPLVKLDWPVPP